MKKKKNVNKIIISASITLVILGVAGWFFFHEMNSHNRFGNKNFPNKFQLNKTQINEINSFFNSNPTQNEINNYCNQSMPSCFYYCRNENSSNEFCGELKNYNSTARNRQWNH